MGAAHAGSATRTATLVLIDMPQAAGAGRKIVMLQLNAEGFVKQGVEKLLDSVRQRAGVNGLLLDTFWFSRMTAGTWERCIPSTTKISA